MGGRRRDFDGPDVQEKISLDKRAGRCSLGAVSNGAYHET